MVAIGFNDIVSNPKNLIFIEWPERIQNLIPKPFIAVTFEHTQEESARDISFEYEKK
jgi:tRNA A37 threonylcarbamoyladenosine biosynthesis protein TsaE